MDETQSTLGERIREARIAAGYDKGVAFAAALEVSKETVSRIENDRQTPGVDLLRKIAELTGRPMYELAAGHEQAVAEAVA